MKYKYLAYLELIIAGVSTINLFILLFQFFAGHSATFNIWGDMQFFEAILTTVVGFAGGIYLLKDNPLGPALSKTWAGIQIPYVVVQVNQVQIPVSFQQFFSLEFHLSWTNTVGFILIGVNVVGVILFLLFYFLHPTSPPRIISEGPVGPGTTSLPPSQLPNQQLPQN